MPNQVALPRVRASRRGAGTGQEPVDAGPSPTRAGAQSRLPARGISRTALCLALPGPAGARAVRRSAGPRKEPGVEGFPRRGTALDVPSYVTRVCGVFRQRSRVLVPLEVVDGRLVSNLQAVDDCYRNGATDQTARQRAPVDGIVRSSGQPARPGLGVHPGPARGSAQRATSGLRLATPRVRSPLL